MKRVEVDKPELIDYSSGLLYTSGTRWGGLVLERGRVDPGVMSEGYLLSHAVVLMRKCARHHQLKVPGRGRHTVRPDTSLVQFFPAHMPYAGEWDEPEEGILLLLTRDFVQSIQGDESKTDQAPPTYWTTHNQMLSDLILGLDRDASEGSPQGKLYGECLGAAFVAELLRLYSSSPITAEERSSKFSKRLDTVLDYTHDNLSADLSLWTLAAMAGVSVDRFMNLFKRRTGCTPHQYVLRERISVARSLLMHASCSVTDIALEVGFKDQSHFSKAFRRMTGTSPAMYRKRSKAKGFAKSDLPNSTPGVPQHRVTD